MQAEQNQNLQSNIKVYCAYDEIVDINKLKPNPKNPNSHPQGQIEILAKVITEQGWRQPIKVSNQSGYIVSGHGRYEAALFMGAEFVPVDYQDYENEAAELADLLADNRIAELAEMDDKALSELFSELNALDFDLSLAGYADEVTIALADAIEEDDEIVASVPFTDVLREEHNYIVLYFDNEVDWLQAESIFPIETVQMLSTRTDGKVSEGMKKTGVGRVINGAVALEMLRNAYKC